MGKTDFDSAEDAADTICEQLGDYGDTAAQNTAAEQWAVGPAALTWADVRGIVNWLLEEQDDLLSSDSEEYLEEVLEVAD